MHQNRRRGTVWKTAIVGPTDRKHILSVRGGSRSVNTSAGHALDEDLRRVGRGTAVPRLISVLAALLTMTVSQR
jgi:hypothetical protein